MSARGSTRQRRSLNKIINSKVLIYEAHQTRTGVPHIFTKEDKMAKKGDWVRIHSIVLKAEERTAKLPEDTKACDLEQWTKGFLLADAEIGDEVEVETVVGRIEKGTLIDDAPYYDHDYGHFVPELIEVDKVLRKEMAEIGGVR